MNSSTVFEDRFFKVVAFAVVVLVMIAVELAAPGTLQDAALRLIWTLL